MKKRDDYFFGESFSAGPEPMRFEVQEDGHVFGWNAPSSAEYDNVLRVFVNGNELVPTIHNHKTEVWEKIDFGLFKAGDDVEFSIDVLNTGEVFSSNYKENFDGIGHLHSANYGQNDMLYLGFEDLGYEGIPGDLDYNDAVFHFQNVSIL